MLRKFLNWFGKEGEPEMQVELPQHEEAKFVLKVDGISIGVLYCDKGVWFFKYTEEFKSHADEYTLITGFSQLDKTYQSDSLWPFFQTRIPGLKQPAVREILEKENIDQTNEAALLKRFGYKTITNPYQLLAS